jgi:hypothetical protein
VGFESQLADSVKERSKVDEMVTSLQVSSIVLLFCILIICLVSCWWLNLCIVGACTWFTGSLQSMHRFCAA